MRNRYDLFGSLPDTIEDEWIQDVEHLDEYLSQFTERSAGPTLSTFVTEQR
jgi:hypothetical protein